MRLTSRLCASLIASVAAVSLVLAWYQTRAHTRDLNRELQRQALVLAEALAKSAEPLVQTHSLASLQALVNQFKDREQVAGIVIFDAARQPLAMTAGLAPRLSPLPPPVKQAMDDGKAHAQFLTMDGDRMHVVALPMHDDPAVTGLVTMFHDTTYISARIAGLWRRALIGVAVQTLLIGCITLLTLRFGYGRPLARMADWMKELRMGAATGVPSIPEHGEFAPLTQEVHRLASSLVAARAAAEEEARLRDTAESKWTAERLRVCVRSRLGDSRLFAVSNREPYEHVHRGDRDRVRGAGQRSGDGAGAGSASLRRDLDRAGHGRRRSRNGGRAGRLRVPPDHPQYTLRRVWLTEEEEEGFYLGLRQRRALAALPHRAHAAHVSRGRLGTVPRGQSRSSPTRC